MLTDKTRKQLTRYWFDSLPELARFADEAPVLWPYDYSRSEGPSTSWDLRAGYDGAVELARNGWIEGAQQAQNALKVFTPTTPDFELRNDFYGHMPNVPRYCAGAPDNMLRHSPTADRGFGRVLTLVVSVCANAGTNAKYMANYGVGIAQYINQMETQGTRVEVIAAMAATLRNGGMAYAFRVKSADQPLDLAVLAFAIGHPACFRRLGFGVMERSTAAAQSNYGVARSIGEADIINCPVGAVFLNGMDSASSNAPTAEKAFAHIAAQVELAIEQKELA